MNVLLLAAFLWRGCSSDPKPAPTPVPSGSGGSAEPGGTGGDAGSGGAHPCERACARLAQLGCPEAKPTPGGGSCVSVCQNVEDSGIVTLDPECVAKISSCAEIERCTGSGQ